MPSPLNISNHIGAKLTINGLEYTLSIEDSLAGELALWTSEKFYIYATPCFNDIPIAIDIYDMDYMSLGVESSFKDINSFEEYCTEIKVIAELIFKEML